MNLEYLAKDLFAVVLVPGVIFLLLLAVEKKKMPLKSFLSLVLGIAGIAGYWLWHPGGRLNPHQWMSQSVYSIPTPQQIADYEKCEAAIPPQEPGTYWISPCFDPRTTFEVFRVAITDQRADKTKPPNFKEHCWLIDFCIKHGESRVTECKP